VFQVVVVPPEDVVAALEPFRRLHDPAFHRHPPHLALTGPFDAGDAEALLRRFLAFSAPSVLVTFDDPRAEGSALVLPVRDEAGRVAALAAAVQDAVLPVGMRLRGEPFVPHLRVGVIAGDAEREMARRAFTASVERVPAFVASDATLLVEDVRGLWHEVRRVELAAPGGGAAAG
jgi:2'-5' RNA ligase